MPDLRAYAVPHSLEPRQLVLSAEESHHLVVVNRARRGDLVVVFDGRGTEWECQLETPDKRAAVLQVTAAQPVRPLPFDLTLAQALPKGAVMDAIVRKATEIGVRTMVALETERTQVHFEAERSDRKLEKWRTAALEACKQCGNPWLPEIRGPLTLAAFLQAAPPADLKLIASLLPDATPLRPVLDTFEATHGRPPRTAIWLVGPEGDFSPRESAEALAAGFLPVSLGPLVLRCDTAATYAASILSYELLLRTR